MKYLPNEQLMLDLNKRKSIRVYISFTFVVNGRINNFTKTCLDYIKKIPGLYEWQLQDEDICIKTNTDYLISSIDLPYNYDPNRLEKVISKAKLEMVSQPNNIPALSFTLYHHIDRDVFVIYQNELCGDGSSYKDICLQFLFYLFLRKRPLVNKTKFNDYREKELKKRHTEKYSESIKNLKNIFDDELPELLPPLPNIPKDIDKTPLYEHIEYEPDVVRKMFKYSKKHHVSLPFLLLNIFEQSLQSVLKTKKLIYKSNVHNRNHENKHMYGMLSDSIFIQQSRSSITKHTTENYRKYKKSQKGIYVEDTMLEFTHMQNVEFCYNFMGDASAPFGLLNRIALFLVNMKVKVEFNHHFYTSEPLIDKMKLVYILTMSTKGELIIYIKANPRFVSRQTLEQVKAYTIKLLNKYSQ